MIIFKPKKTLSLYLSCSILLALLSACNSGDTVNSSISTVRAINQPTHIKPSEPYVFTQNINSTGLKKLSIALNNSGQYAYVSLYANEELLVDHFNIAQAGAQTLNTLVELKKEGLVHFKLVVKGAPVTVERVEFESLNELAVPAFKDITVAAGMDKASSIKYGGPSIADIDNDGDYDFIVNNHNAESSKLYWNNGDGTVTKHKRDLARWFMHDLHGTALGDYDNDGDLDLVLTMGGGNGKNLAKNNFYHNNQGTLVLQTGDVGIDRGGRGRGAKWVDMDLDGDLDLMMINEATLTHTKPQHYFYKNTGDGTFAYTPIKGLEDVESSRALITDLNQDNIDDVILYSPISIWLGNGDFTYTDVTAQLPAGVAELKSVMAMTDIDIDNDGDLDLYLARGKVFEHGYGEAPSVDHDPIAQLFSIKPRGDEGVNQFEFTADGVVKFHQYKYLKQGVNRNKDYPIYLGENKSSHVLTKGQELLLNPEAAMGWPKDISQDGIYFGYLGKGKWKSALVRNDKRFWTFRFSLAGVKDVNLGFEAENRNIPDILLRNDNGHFTDVSREWNLPTGGNALGVTTGDFNNDSFQDLFVYRWGLIGSRISDYLLLNTGKGHFETVTMHGANDIGGPGNGDMGQAFDFDLDGDIDLLNGSEDGEWYLYQNAIASKADKAEFDANYALVNVGYAPKSNIDAISAQVTINTKHHKYVKRVGSAGAIFSQSLLNIVHFGLGKEQDIVDITVRWRNGETVHFKNKQANQLFDTNKVDPISIDILAPADEIRQGSTFDLQAQVLPKNADVAVIWASQNERILSVNQSGQVKAVGEVGESTMITATSLANGLSVQHKLQITNWAEKPVESLSLLSPVTRLTVGESMVIKPDIQPDLADNAALNWTSSNSNIATVSPKGEVTALQKGEVVINAQLSSDHSIQADIKLTIEPFIEPFIEIINASEFDNGVPITADKITVKVKYHAGTGSQVISADEGGIRFWLRHFKSKWFPAKDIVLTDTSVLKSQSGYAEMEISLKDVLPTESLPQGHFYLLRASFSSSNGAQPDATIYPLNIDKD